MIPLTNDTLKLHLTCHGRIRTTMRVINAGIHTYCLFWRSKSLRMVISFSWWTSPELDFLRTAAGTQWSGLPKSMNVWINWNVRVMYQILQGDSPVHIHISRNTFPNDKDTLTRQIKRKVSLTWKAMLWVERRCEETDSSVAMEWRYALVWILQVLQLHSGSKGEKSLAYMVFFIFSCPDSMRAQPNLCKWAETPRLKRKYEYFQISSFGLIRDPW